MEDRSALVTGGAGGIGTALTKTLLAHGYRVTVADLLPPRASSGVLFVKTDVGDQTSVEAAVQHAHTNVGRLDAVFLNAGVTSERIRFDRRIDAAAYRRALAVNLDGVVFGVNAALPVLRASDSPVIVATASLGGMMPVPSDPIYCATKAAVIGLVRSLGPAIAPIRINAVCPTFTDTPILDGIRSALEEMEAPMLTPAAVAEALLVAAETEQSGECFFVQLGRPVEPFAFRRPPGPRTGRQERRRSQ